MRAILEACAVDDPRCDDTADLFGDQHVLLLIGVAIVAVIVVIAVLAVLIDRTLARRTRRDTAGIESGPTAEPTR